MDIRQVSVTYREEQDRILVRINTAQAEELRLWFTRRLVLGLWPALSRAIVQTGELAAAAEGRPAPGDAAQARRAHEAGDALACHGQPIGLEFRLDARRAVGAPRREVDGADALREALVLAGSGRGLALPPRVVA